MNIKATKSDLNKIINWSSSKFNELKKSEVVERIIFLIEKGEDTEVRFVTGSYTEHGSLGGWDYVLKVKDGIVSLTEIKTTLQIYNIEKPKKNKLYTGANKIKVIQEKYEWHKKIIGKEFQVVDENESSYYFNVSFDEGERKMAIDKKLVSVVV